MEINEKTRKSYIKPRVTQVKLEIKDAILAGCKVTNGGPGPTAGLLVGTCKTGALAGRCKNDLGS